ncbi:MAG: barstar family protein [Pyrinomonadaceae bacterium]
MTFVRINTEQITDWASFHSVCKEAFGFPDFYGNNMNAWIDCMSYLSEDVGMTKFKLAEDEMLHIETMETEDFKTRLPEIFDALIECSAFVNNRNAESKESAKVAFVFL